MVSVVVAHGLSCSAACGILPDHGSNTCPLHWQADSYPLRHEGSPKMKVLEIEILKWLWLHLCIHEVTYCDTDYYYYYYLFAIGAFHCSTIILHTFVQVKAFPFWSFLCEVYLYWTFVYLKHAWWAFQAVIANGFYKGLSAFAFFTHHWVLKCRTIAAYYIAWSQ